MAQIDNQLKSIWDGLRGNRPHRVNFLEEINIRNMRGIRDLRVPFDYPVTVLAGENACGKSTVLFGCAAAYQSPGSSAKRYAPATLFPSFSEGETDNMEGIELEYAYINERKRMGMKWRRGKSWNKSFLGRKGVTQPKREIYLRTLANLTNPSEVRSMLQIKRRQPTVTTVGPDLILLAQRVLSFNYENISKVEKNRGVGNLLLAELEGSMGKYSEFHMASGERSILRLSMEISTLKDSLVLIDEVETGLHPYIQKLLMLNLQRMALRQELQIIVTTHSPVVLSSVPLEGRIFLRRDRQNHNVRVEEPMRDIMQKAMYGQSTDKLSIMCEDGFSEEIIRGVVDALSRKIDFHAEHIFVGRNTGKDEFPNHIRTLKKVALLSNFIFVLDGDGRDIQEKIQHAAAQEEVTVLFLPGDSCPEKWVWQEIKREPEYYGELLAVPQLQSEIHAIEQQISGAVNLNPKDLFKTYLHTLSDSFSKTSREIGRAIARDSTHHEKSKIMSFVIDLEEEIRKWRTRE